MHDRKYLDALRQVAQQGARKKEQQRENLSASELQAKIVNAIDHAWFLLNQAAVHNHDVSAEVFDLLPSELAEWLEQDVGNARVIEYFENMYTANPASLNTMLGPVALAVVEFLEKEGLRIIVKFRNRSRGYQIRQAFLYAYDPNPTE